MDKEYYNNVLEEAILKYESEESILLDERITRLNDVIKLGREYNQKYKTPYKHYFMGKPIRYTNDLLDVLEQLIIQTNK